MSLTMSNALEKSIAMVNMRCETQGSLEPQAILHSRGMRAATVEWLGRKLCWVDERGSKTSFGYAPGSNTSTSCLI